MTAWLDSIDLLSLGLLTSASALFLFVLLKALLSWLRSPVDDRDTIASGYSPSEGHGLR